MTTTTTAETLTPELPTILIEGVKYQVFYNDDPDCPVSIRRLPSPTELGHKGRSWTGR